MEEGDYLAVWLFDRSARAILGLPASKTERRWCVLGSMKKESPVGVWIDVEAVQEREKGPGAKVVRSWQIQPKTSLIRWDYVIHAQIWGTATPEKREIGFTSSKPS